MILLQISQYLKPHLFCIVPFLALKLLIQPLQTKLCSYKPCGQFRFHYSADQSQREFSSGNSFLAALTISESLVICSTSCTQHTDIAKCFSVEYSSI